MTVYEVFQRTLLRLQTPATCSIFEALREVQAIITQRLLQRQSALLKKAEAAELEFAAGEGSAPLHRDFLALDGRPFVVGARELKPLAEVPEMRLQQPGTPRCYEVAGRSLRIYPVPDAPVVVQAPYFYRPPVPTALEDELPFYGEFDGVLVEGCVGVMAQGLSVVADRSFVAVIQSQVDAVLLSQDLLAEQLLADAINER